MRTGVPAGSNYLETASIAGQNDKNLGSMSTGLGYNGGGGVRAGP
jgi:hypothetical protein